MYKTSLSNARCRQDYATERTIRLPAILVLACLFSALTGCTRRQPIRTFAQPTRPVSTSEEAAHRLTSRLAQTLRGQGPIRIVVTEDELTSYLDLNLQRAPVRELSVWFTPGGIHVRAKIRARHELTLQALLRLTLRDGAPQVKVDWAALNGHPLPRLLLASVQEAANDALADAHPALRMERVVLGEGFMIITGSTHQGG